MPNDCYCEVRIGAEKENIQRFIETEFSFEKLCPYPFEQKDDWYEWNNENWGTKWDRYNYKLIRRGQMAMEAEFVTAWNPPTAFFEYLVETSHDVWIKCDWYEEGGYAGVVVVYWDKEVGKVKKIEEYWDDWCLEEWAMRMRPAET